MLWRRVLLRSIWPMKMTLCDNEYKVSIGRRAYLEDRIYESGNFGAVFDGHGGKRVAELCRQNMHKEFNKALNLQGSILGTPSIQGKDVELALSTAFQEMDKLVCEDSALDHMGSTATVVLAEEDCFWTAHVGMGDSRAVLSRGGVAIPLTVDNKPNDEMEKERILKLGGKVTWYGSKDEAGRPIEGLGVYRVNDNLAMSRAIGDKAEKPYVISNAMVSRFQRRVLEDEFVVIASDGIWDVLKNEDVVNIVNSNISWQEDLEAKREKPQEIIEEALRRGSTDNMAVVIMWLK